MNTVLEKQCQVEGDGRIWVSFIDLKLDRSTVAPGLTYYPVNGVVFNYCNLQARDVLPVSAIHGDAFDVMRRHLSTCFFV